MSEPINIPEARLIWASNRQAFNDGRPASVHQSLALLTVALDEIDTLRTARDHLTAERDEAIALCRKQEKWLDEQREKISELDHTLRILGGDVVQ